MGQIKKFIGRYSEGLVDKYNEESKTWALGAQKLVVKNPGSFENIFLGYVRS